MPKKRRREWGSGTAFRPKARETWSISWREDGVRRYEHGLADEPAARKRLAVVLGDLAAGRSQRAPSVQTLNEHAERWLEARASTHRSAYDDRNRWDNHLRRALGHLKPDGVTIPILKAFMAKKKTEGLSTSTINLLIRLLSTFFTDLVEAGDAAANPVRALSKKTRAVYLRAAHDPKRTPFVEDLADVARIYQALYAKAPAVSTAYAIGALAGLRTSEVRALRWEHVDLRAGIIHVQVQVERRKGRAASSWSADGTAMLKDRDSRVVPIQPGLAPILFTRRSEFTSAPAGLVCPPLRKGSRRFLDDHTMGAYLREVLQALGLARPGLGWYECTRHTMASQYVMAGGALETLQRILGHSTVLVTERYAHLRPGHYSIADRNRLDVDLGAAHSAPDLGAPAAGAPQMASEMASGAAGARPDLRLSRGNR